MLDFHQSLINSILRKVLKRLHYSLDGRSWRLDEIHISVSVQWKYIYRAIDRAGDTVDSLLTSKHDLAAARRFLERGQLAVKRIPDQMLGFKSSWGARVIIAGIKSR
jgi:hypothetical protein